MGGHGGGELEREDVAQTTAQSATSRVCGEHRMVWRDGDAGEATIMTPCRGWIYDRRYLSLSATIPLSGYSVITKARPLFALRTAFLQLSALFEPSLTLPRTLFNVVATIFVFYVTDPPSTCT